MPTCQNCNKQWSWKQTLKKSFTLDDGMICPHCGKKQYINARTRKRNKMVSFSVPALMFLNLLFGPSLVFLFILIGTLPLYLGLYPFYLELSNKKEPLW